MSKRKIFRIVWFSAVGIFLIWNWSTFQSRNLPGGTFETDQNISVSEDGDKITFSPTTTDKKTEVIFFQGGMADPKAYAPLCRDIAGNGFKCHLIKMSWRLPQYDYEKVSELFDLNSGHYVIGGHSQGGKMASQVVYENQHALKGLFLLGTSHPRETDLSHLTIPTIKLYAEHDGLASVQEVMDNKHKLPKDSRLRIIKGGNHSQFGYLGRILMDDEPQISLEAQQRETVDQLVSFLNEVEEATDGSSLFGDSIVYKTDHLVIQKLSPHCYLHTSYLNTTDFGRVPCNGMLVVNRHQAVVFDTPSDSASSDELIRFVSGTLGSSIEAVVATHFHEDCVGGLEVFEARKIPSYASDKTIALLKEKGSKSVALLQGFDDSLDIRIADKHVHAEFFGEGHTKDNVIGYYADDQVVFGGCLIKEVGAGKGNLEDANVDDWSGTVRKIKQQLPNVKIVVPGHGKPGGTALFDYTIRLFE